VYSLARLISQPRLHPPTQPRLYPPITAPPPYPYHSPPPRYVADEGEREIEMAASGFIKVMDGQRDSP